MKRFIALLAALGAVLSACASTPVASTVTAPASSFPATLTASNGAVTIHARPRRIMSLSASATSMLYDIGAGRQVVAVDKYSTDPPNAPRTNLTGYETGPESFVPFHPDLVVLAFDESGNLTSQLAALGIAVLLLPPATSVNGTYAQILLLGRATGHETGAAAENVSIKAKLAAVVSSVGSRARGLTYYQELDPTLYTATSRTFIGSLYGLLGMVNVADRAGTSGDQYPQLSTEFLIKANPDDVFLADDNCCGQSAASFAARPGFGVLHAVTTHHVFALPDALVSQWGPRIVIFLQDVARDLLGASHT
ncbi:MAG TPA: ABC transporter substrate-binding protein [Acidimicrobiales bacterium]|nr:ABC transporter substrate-binding protein [Acidimicrobiales bacterium]